MDLNFRKKIFREFVKTQHRGPDNSIFRNIKNHIIFGFHRLAIVDTTIKGNQPFEHKGIYLICNGEIYNHDKLTNDNDFVTFSNSDCEVIIHLYLKYGIERTIKMLDGVFAFVLYDSHKNLFHVSRDHIGVRSLYLGFDEESICFSSEMKSMVNISNNINLFPPGTLMSIHEDVLGNLKKFNPNKFYIKCNSFDLWDNPSYETSLDETKKQLKYLFTKAVNKRLMSDRQVGCLLSGGLDSSLVTALVAKNFAPGELHTFSIGMFGATDLKYARMVAEHIGSTHHEIIVTEKQMLEAIEKTIYYIESWDTTTIRASTPMVLLCEYIKKNTNVTVIYSGEGSDEASGSYMYFHNAPNNQEFHKETIRLIKDLQYFDVLRCDKSVSSAGLEARVPFLDKEFLNFYMTINPKYKIPFEGVEKYLLRSSFDDTNLLPKEVLWRTKEAFSDGCSTEQRSWYEILQEHIEIKYTDKAFKSLSLKHSFERPKTKEALYFRHVFLEHFNGHDKIIPYYWLPKWSGEISEPSARILPIYKKNK